MATEAQIRVICEIRGCYIFRVNSWLNTKIAHFESIMQNKPNLLDAQMNVRSLITVDYENKIAFGLPKNKPNSRKGIIDAKCVFTKDYEEKCG